MGKDKKATLAHQRGWQDTSVNATGNPARRQERLFCSPSAEMDGLWSNKLKDNQGDDCVDQAEEIEYLVADETTLNLLEPGQRGPLLSGSQICNWVCARTPLSNLAIFYTRFEELSSAYQSDEDEVVGASGAQGRQ